MKSTLTAPPKAVYASKFHFYAELIIFIRCRHHGVRLRDSFPYNKSNFATVLSFPFHSASLILHSLKTCEECMQPSSRCFFPHSTGTKSVTGLKITCTGTDDNAERFPLHGTVLLGSLRSVSI